jgi:hypothetical protein
VYPVFYRDKTFIEYLPFVSGPPNEIAATPAGMPPIAGGTLVPVGNTSDSKAPAGSKSPGPPSSEKRGN